MKRGRGKHFKAPSLNTRVNIKRVCSVAERRDDHWVIAV